MAVTKKINKVYFSLQWHLTDSCDQRCKHCYIYQNKNKVNLLKGLPFATVEMILSDFIEFCKEVEKLPHIALTGGDPLLYDSFWELVDLINKKQISFSILGNPFHLNKEVANRLKRYGCKSYQMSIDGMENTHDSIRGKNSFRSTIDKISCINDSGMRSAVMTTISKINACEIKELVKLVVDLKVSDFRFARYCPTHNDIENFMSPAEYKEFLNNCWNTFNEYKNQNTTKFIFKDHLWKLFLYEKGLLYIDSHSKNIEDGCSCGIRHITALPDGTIYACRRFESPVGKVPEMSLFDIFQSNEIEKYRKFEKFEACSKCPLFYCCRGCPAVSFGIYGNFYAKDPQCWYNSEGGDK